MILDLPYDVIHLLIKESTMRSNIALLKSCKYLYNTFYSDLEKILLAEKDTVFYNPNDTYKDYLGKKQFVIDKKINLNTTYEFRFNHWLHISFIANAITVSENNVIVVQRSKQMTILYKSIYGNDPPLEKTKYYYVHNDNKPSLQDTNPFRTRIKNTYHILYSDNYPKKNCVRLAFKSCDVNRTTPIIAVLKNNGICTVYDCNYEEFIDIMKRIMVMIKSIDGSIKYLRKYLITKPALKIVNTSVKSLVATKLYTEYLDGYLFDGHYKHCPPEWKQYFTVAKHKESASIDIYREKNTVTFCKITHIDEVIKLYTILEKLIKLLAKS